MLRKLWFTGAALLSAAVGQTAEQSSQTAFEQADADKDGQVTRAEFLAARAERFSRLDRNADGFIDGADVPARFAARTEGNGRESADANGDGKVSKEEFDAAPTPAFDAADKNIDGVLDQQELNAAKANGRERFRQRRQRHGND